MLEEREARTLLTAAMDASRRAYAPYSGFPVGAALRTTGGHVFTGCNVENASFGMTWCAERTAIVKAVSEGARDFATLAIATSLPRGIMPCGACRQVLHEFASDLRIVVVGADGRRYATVLEDILPEAFGPADMPQS